MTELKKYTVRPCKNQRTDLRNSFRVHVSLATLSSLRLNSEGLCNIITLDNRSLPAIASAAKVMDSVVMTTRTLQVAYGLNLGDQVTISRSDESVRDAEEIVLEEVPDTSHDIPPPYKDEEHKTHWSYLLRYHACQAQVLCHGMVFKSISSVGERRSFRVVRTSGSQDPGLYNSEHTTKVHIQERIINNAQSTDAQTGILEITNERIGGLHSQINEINKILRPYSNCGIEFKKYAWHEPRRGGLILHGPKGTGKSMILGEIAKAGWNRVFHITRKTISLPKTSRDEAVRSIFADANAHQPSVVIIDGLDRFAGKTNPPDDQHSLHIASSLQEAFDHQEDNRVLVVAATDCLANIVTDLRDYGRFHHEIEISVPNSPSRKEILKLLCRLSATSSHPQLEALAERTHGYVGKDLKELLQVAADNTAEDIPKGDLAEQDIESALNLVKPGIMKGAIQGLPKVKWSDIAGSDGLKKQLEHVVTSIKHDEERQPRSRKPKKNVLLYGPPGCSKTMTAQAMASEMELNFFAVNAGEFYSMYVGESERALRDIFERARAARPSILFFDELDAIGRSRGRDHGGLNVLQTMLTEMDGIIPLNGVLIMAATNRKDLLDSALLRRFDTRIFVGLPDFETRLAIIRSTMPEDSLLDLTEIARATEGFSGADVAQIWNEADDRATIGSGPIRQEHVDDALEEMRRSMETLEV